MRNFWTIRTVTPVIWCVLIVDFNVFLGLFVAFIQKFLRKCHFVFDRNLTFQKCYQLNIDVLY